MFFTALVSCLAHNLTLPPISVAPAPREIQSSFFPTRVGSKLIYTLSTGNDLIEEVVKVVQVSNGRKVFTRVRHPIGSHWEAVYLISKTSGLHLLKSGLDGFDEHHPPMHLLKLPYKKGRKWTTFLGAWGLGQNTLVILGREKVKVPAGTFDAIKVETRFPSRFEPNGTLTHFWYAEGIGLVKRDYGKSTIVLKSFTPGK